MEFRHLAEIAARQHGIVTIADCRMCGIPDRTVQRWANDGRLIRPHDGVFQIAGAPDSVEAGIYAAIRAAGDGAAASHRAAAYLWGLSEDVPIPEITVPYERAVVLDGVAVHRSRDLDGARLSIRRAILVTDPMRTLIDCGAVVGRGAVEDMLDTGLARQLFSHAAMERAYTKVARPGRHGSGTMRRILDTRALGAARADSLLEPRMARLVVAYGLRPPDFQHPVFIDGKRYVIDFAYPDLLIAVEVDGWAKFASPAGAQQVLDRQNALARAGWRVLRFTWTDVVRRPDRVAATIAETLALFL